jgi:hypothetical protein
MRYYWRIPGNVYFQHIKGNSYIICSAVLLSKSRKFVPKKKNIRARILSNSTGKEGQSSQKRFLPGFIFEPYERHCTEGIYTGVPYTKSQHV